MRVAVDQHIESQRTSAFLVLAAIIFAISALRPAPQVWAELPPVTDNPASRRTVHARELPQTSVDNQTSWIIEPDVPRVPKIPGLYSQLPPHIEQRLSYAFNLAQRGALYSSNAEFRAVIGLCALELDSQSDGTSHRDALREGFIALEEADDFGGDQLDWHDAADVRRLVAEHSTPVLKNESKPIDSIEAVQRYYAFAEQRLTAACKDLPGASIAFYGLARTFVEPDMHATHAAAKAALLQRVALAIAPQNVLARNELGVLLAQHGQFAESEQLFRQCVATSPRPECWQNLSAVYAREGDMVDSHAAMAAAQALTTSQNAGQTTGGTPSTSLAKQTEQNKSDSSDGKRKEGFMAKLKLPSFLFWK